MIDSSRDPFTQGSQLRANRSDAENTLSNFIEYTSTGFTINTTDGGWNANGETYIYMAWAGSYSDFITDYNTDGSIDSRVKASDTTGFSIVSTEDHTGSQTVGHGLSSAPDWIVAKARSGSLIWPVYHSALGNTKRLRLNDNTQEETNAVWGNTDPTTSVFTFNQSSNTHNYIFYCWTATAGVSAFGSYTGNGSSVSVTTGFLPAFILIKRSNSSAANTNWEIHDNTRNTAGELLGVIYPNTNGVEGFNNSGSSITTTDNSFTVNGSGGSINGNNDSYLYAAFADTREAAFWLDQSGNDNDWQPVNLDHNDTLLDSPTDNFATLNPLDLKTGTTLSDGNLVRTDSVEAWESTVSTMAVSSGKYYVEFTPLAVGSTVNIMVGVVQTGFQCNVSDSRFWASFDGHSYHAVDGNKVINGSGSSVSYGDSWTVGDVIGVALDLDAGEIEFYKNGVSQGVANTGLSGTYHFACASYQNGTKIECNFGQQPFKYDPPA